MRFIAHLDQLSKALTFVKDFAREKVARKKVARKKLDQLELALEEAIVNVISYAYPSKGGIPENPRYFELACDFLSPDSFSVTLTDSGIPFDPTKNPLLEVSKIPLKKREIGGLGLVLIRNGVNVLTYRREGVKNILTMQMKLS